MRVGVGCWGYGLAGGQPRLPAYASLPSLRILLGGCSLSGHAGKSLV